MKKILLIITALAIIGVSGYGLYNLNSQDDTVKSSVETTEQVLEEVADRITFSDEGKTVVYEGEAGVSALVTLQSLTEVTLEESQFGEMVTGINGVLADSSKEYWSFYVNDKYANEGAGTYKAKAGDTFKWQLEKLQ